MVYDYSLITRDDEFFLISKLVLFDFVEFWAFGPAVAFEIEPLTEGEVADYYALKGVFSFYTA